MWDAVAAGLKAHGVAVDPASATPVGGGSINRAFRVAGRDGRRCFVKVNDAALAHMFEAEAAGLEELARPGALRVPQPLCTGVAGTHAFLALEWIEFGASTEASAQALGAGLAALHRHTSAHYGWYRDNTIGSTPQVNTPAHEWWTFFVERRLQPQFALAAGRGGRGRRLAAAGEELCAALGALSAGEAPAASLVHGDLWGGNWGTTRAGEPVIFDPAVYYGDPETDIAMTELFGGFPPAFYAAYREVHPDTDGGPVRRDVYRLYHVLNHYNLFGGGYAAQSASLIERIRAAL